MTCREKLASEHPEMIDPTSRGGCRHCPSTYGYLEDPHPDLCRASFCGDCWNREIPEETREEAVARVVEAFDDAMGRPFPQILDSGDRTQFETGAVRDMREGKGRCDLMPLEVVARMFDNHDGRTNIFEYIARFKRTNETHHLVKALFKFVEEVYGLKEREGICTMSLEVAKHFEEGAKKYGENNWQKGIPVHCYIDSAIRHYLKWRRGDKDEPHDRAFVWNIMCCIWEVDYREEAANG